MKSADTAILANWIENMAPRIRAPGAAELVENLCSKTPLPAMKWGYAFRAVYPRPRGPDVVPAPENTEDHEAWYRRYVEFAAFVKNGAFHDAALMLIPARWFVHFITLNFETHEPGYGPHIPPSWTCSLQTATNDEVIVESPTLAGAIAAASVRAAAKGTKP